MSDQIITSNAANTTTTTTVEEHPEGDAIRKRVERYFSDENLPHDAYMLALTGGAENWPVSVSRINGFYKMRQYKPHSQVKASLRKSTFLEFTDSKHIRRRRPLAIEPTVTPEAIDEMKRLQRLEKQSGYSQGKHDTQHTQADGSIRHSDKEDKQHTQAKQNGQVITSKRKGMLEPTGFEENFADAPVTPAEYIVNQDLYDPSISFPTRIETAIQRYRARRKFHTDTARIYSEFLSFGGIDSEQRQFTGRLTKADLQDMDAADIASLTGLHTVRDAVLDPQKWEVDFAGVANGFLSTEMFLSIFEDNNPKQVQFFTNVLANFYRWLMHNDVCVEYNDQLTQALATCTKANDELTKSLDLTYKLPDGFSTACSTFFGGYFHDLYQPDQPWMKGDMPVGWGFEDANGLVMAGISVYGTDEQFEAASSTSARKIVKQESACLQIVTIEKPTEEARSFYEHSRLNDSKLIALGKIHCRRLKHDLSGPLQDSPVDSEQLLVIWIEENVLDSCFVGMKMKCEVCESNIGIKWLERVTSVNPSYHQILPNEFYEKTSAEVLPKDWYKRQRRIMQYGWQTKQELEGGTGAEHDFNDKGGLDEDVQESHGAE